MKTVCVSVCVCVCVWIGGLLIGFLLLRKGTVFFSRENLTPLTHSLSENFCSFFSRFWKKKINTRIFFPRKSLKATHSAERQLPLRNRYFCTFAVFFSNQIVYYFFPRKCLQPTHSLVLRGRRNKKTRREKKHIFHSLPRLFPKSFDI